MPQDTNNLLSQFVILIPMILLIVWMFMSQKKKSKQVKEMINSVQPGKIIKTIGGFYGKVISVKEDLIVFECGPDKAKLEIAKEAVATVEDSEVSKEALE